MGLYRGYIMGIRYRLWEFLFAGLWGLFLLYCTGEVM